MVPQLVNAPADGWSLSLRLRDWQTLTTHLFCDDDEHGAVVLAEQVEGPRGPRLLARRVLLAEDGIDYVPGVHGYRALTATFVRDCIDMAASAGQAYLAVHNHGGRGRVNFSRTDLASHERGYPALRQITGQAVGGVVLAQGAAAGDLWLPDGSRAKLSELVVAGNNLTRLCARPGRHNPVDSRYDRQSRMFGDAGQAVLTSMRVGVVGLGGAGSLIVEFLSRLGVGQLTLIDHDLVTEHNLPRLVAAERDDVGRPKTEIAVRNARRSNSQIQFDLHQTVVQDLTARTALTQCDWVFLAADTHAARHWVNQTVEQYLIPGTQVGVKIPVDENGHVGTIHTASRPLVPGEGCLWCNGLINPTELAIDMAPAEQQRAARYVEDVPAPSVIGLNAVAASEAVNHFMLAATRLHEDDADTAYTLTFPRTREHQLHNPRRSPDCRWCGNQAEPTGRSQLPESRHQTEKERR